MPVEFCADDALGYRRSLTDFAEPLTLDESYRLAHLPLLAPEHPRAIPRLPGRDYESGRHAEIFSLVMPVPQGALEASPAWRELDAGLRASPFAGKLAWELLPKRADRLHATIVGSLGRGEPPAIASEIRARLAGIAPFEVELRGLFSGNVNRGRLYLRAYPQRRAGANPFQQIQQAFGRPAGDLYLVGLHNLLDDLDPAETQALAALIARCWETPLLRLRVDGLSLMGATDDLVLESRIVETLPLGGPPPP
ncbi:hypothetical protein [Bosea sp. (in: a-proteobacteria)]|uniref:hypothetical protein n=1 Tax=Bosea sp. (in: a-proteobacteria) TaxID=1871050 RepID=UPI002FC58E8F